MSTFVVFDGSSEEIGQVVGDIESLLHDVPAWENDLQRTLKQIVDDNEGFITEATSGRIVYDSEEDV